MTLTSTDVTNRRFPAARFREGYEMEQVDEFLDRIASTLQAWEQASRLGQVPAGSVAASLLRANDVLNAKFQATLLREGYVQDEVDEFLDRVTHTLRQWEASASWR